MGRSNNSNNTVISGESGTPSYLPNFPPIGTHYHPNHAYSHNHLQSDGHGQLPSPPPAPHNLHSHSYLAMSHLANVTQFYESGGNNNNLTPPARVYSPSSHGSNSSSGSSSNTSYGSNGGGGHSVSNGSVIIMESVNGNGSSAKYEYEDFPQEPDGGPVKISTWKDHVAIFSLDQVGVMCDVLLQEGDMSRLIDLLSTIAKDFIGRSEKILRAQAHVAFHAALDDARKFPQVYKILETHTFSQQYHGGLQKLWFTAHYKEAEITRGRPLGAVDKYRIRRKFPLPRTIWDGEETVYCFKERSRNALRESFTLEKYPNLEEKKKLSKQTGLTMTQVGNWFKNKRQREKEKQQGKVAIKRTKSAYSTSTLAAAMTPDLLGMMLNPGAGSVGLGQNHLSAHHAIPQHIAPMSPEDLENAIRKARFADVDAHRLKSYIDESMYTAISSSSGPANLSNYLHGSGNNATTPNNTEHLSQRHVGLAGKSDITIGIVDHSPGSQQHQSQQQSPRLNNGLTITAIPSPSCNSSGAHLQLQQHSPGDTSRHDGSPGNANSSSEMGGGMHGNHRPRSNSSTGSSGGAKYGADMVVPYLHSGGHNHSAYHAHYHHHHAHHSLGSPLPSGGYDGGVAPLIHNNTVHTAALSHA